MPETLGTLAAVGDVQLTPAEFVQDLKRRRQLRPLLTRALVDKLVAKAAQQADVTVGEIELQQAANRFRRHLGLRDEEQTFRWLEQEGLTADDLEAALTAELLPGCFRDYLVRTRGAKELADHPERYARVRIVRLMTPSQDLAQELLLKVREEGVDFLKLAVEHANGPGIAGPLVLLRGQMPPAVGDAVFATRAGDLVGPLATEQGVVVIQVLELLPAEMDEQTKAALGDDLYRAWLAEQLGALRMDGVGYGQAT